MRYDVADADGWDWPREAFDAVAAIYIQFAPPAMRRRIFGRIWEALRPGGLFLLEGYRLEQLAYGTGGPQIPDQLYTEVQLRDELAAFTLEEVRSYDAVIDEGAAHSGHVRRDRRHRPATGLTARRGARSAPRPPFREEASSAAGTVARGATRALHHEFIPDPRAS